jgi:hypothetical protein
MTSSLTTGAVAQREEECDRRGGEGKSDEPPVDRLSEAAADEAGGAISAGVSTSFGSSVCMSRAARYRCPGVTADG